MGVSALVHHLTGLLPVQAVGLLLLAVPQLPWQASGLVHFTHRAWRARRWGYEDG